MKIAKLHRCNGKEEPGKGKEMFEKFGEMNTIEEINMAAAGLKAEGDRESLMALARENGIEDDDTEDYLEDYVNELIPTPCFGAVAKVQLEVKENEQLYEEQELIHDWIGYIKLEASESEEFARAVRKKGKRLKECIASILKWSFGHMVTVDGELVKAAGINAGGVSLGVPGMRTARELIRDYYLR